MERSYHLLRHAARRHEVHLLALNQRRLSKDGPPLTESLPKLEECCTSVRVCSMPFERSAIHRMIATAYGVVTSLPAERAWLFSPALHRSVEQAASQTPPDLLHVDTIGLMDYARHLRGVPIVLNHHNVESDLTGRRADREASTWRARVLRREARKQQRMERAVCPAVAANVVVSELDAERLRAIAPRSRCWVVENGVDTAYFKPAADPGPEGGLVFVGTLDWPANREAVTCLVHEVLPALSTTGRQRPLALVGRAPRRREWASVPGVTVTGFVPDVRPFLHRACIYVCPIRTGGGTRLKVLAALAVGRPLVATALAVEGLRLIEGVHYLRAESTAEFVSQIRRLEGDSQLRERLRTAGRALVEREYDWAVVATQLDEAYMRADEIGRTTW